MAESLDIGKMKISKNEKEDFHYGDHFADAFKRFENYWKEQKHCDVTLIAGADGTR